ncbi:MAG: hypothetical protein IJ489_00865 [Clostridia bacterium]|nr:hypothetical protein [Clostridia bacterium]
MKIKDYQYFYEQSIDRNKSLDSKLFATFAVECVLASAIVYFSKDITLTPSNFPESLFLITVLGTIITYMIAVVYILKATLDSEFSYINLEELEHTIQYINSLQAQVTVDKKIVNKKINNIIKETYRKPTVFNKEYNIKKEKRINYCISWTFISFCLFVLSVCIHIILINI